MLDSVTQETLNSEIHRLCDLFSQGSVKEVLTQVNQLLKRFPEATALHIIAGDANTKLKRFDTAIENYTKAIDLKPDFAVSHFNLGVVFQDKGDFELAIRSYKVALEINPGYLEAYNNIGSILHDSGDFKAAIESYEKILAIDPNYSKAHNNMGTALKELGNIFAMKGDFPNAITHLEKALQVNAKDPEIYNNLATALFNQKKYDEAIQCFEKAIQINPNYAEALKNKGLCLKLRGQLKGSLIAFNEALNCNPDLFEAKRERLYINKEICDWSEVEQVKHELPQQGISTPPVQPFGFLTLEDHPERQLIRASRYVSKTYSVDPIPLPAKPKSKPDKIRIGYFSADFHEHPVSHQIAKVLASHDRSKIEVYAYSFKQADDNMRKRIIGAVDHFKDVSNMSDRDVALLARDDNIDIAIDLMGYTKNARTNIFAFRVAPIQIVYLYESTMGANFIDYIIADPITIPNRLRHHYREKIIYLPHTYMPTDNTREISNRPMTRQEMELPEDGFVFCCFNNNYKITPREFDIWMRLLLKVENSVLWLSKSNQWAKSNLQKEARLRGIDPSRLVFTKWVTRQDHLARHRLADLFLDTFNFNAHSTASDALWAGLPIITCKGEQFVARCAASFLTAIGLPELIVKTDQEYEALALELATNQSILESIAKKLEKNRRSEPLFKTETYTQNLDQAFEQAYTHYYKGYPPKDIIA